MNNDETLIAGVMECMGLGTDEALEYIEENYLGDFKNLETWAENFLDDTGQLEEIPENLKRYFDYQYWARDCELGGDIFTLDSPTGIYVLWNR